MWYDEVGYDAKFMSDHLSGRKVVTFSSGKNQIGKLVELVRVTGNGKCCVLPHRGDGGLLILFVENADVNPLMHGAFSEKVSEMYTFTASFGHVMFMIPRVEFFGELDPNLLKRRMCFHPDNRIGTEYCVEVDLLDQSMPSSGGDVMAVVDSALDVPVPDCDEHNRIVRNANAQRRRWNKNAVEKIPLWK